MTDRAGPLRPPHPARSVPEDGVALSLGRVTKGVASAIGRSLIVERDGALPDRLASLVERLQAGPLGQPKLNSRRVA